MKACKKCGSTKPITDFYKHKDGKDGIHPQCKECVNKSQIPYRLANAERARERAAAWYLANPDKAAESRAKWQATNPDKVRAAKIKWRTANPEKMRACRNRWAAENPDRARHQQRINNRNRKSRLAIGKLSAGVIKKLLLLQRGKCACCKRPLGDKYHLDHIMPLALGGTNTDDNIQLLRRECNQQKSAKHPVDFMQQKGFLI